MVNSSAPKPKYFTPIQTLEKLDETKTQEKIEKRNEEVLASLADHEGWQIFGELVEIELKKLENLNKDQMSKGASFEELGRNSVMVQLCKDIIKNLTNKVEDAREAVETRRQSTGGSSKD